MVFSPADMQNNLEVLVKQAEKYVDDELAKQTYLVGSKYKITVNKYSSAVLKVLITDYKEAGWTEVFVEETDTNKHLVLICRKLNPSGDIK